MKRIGFSLILGSIVLTGCGNSGIEQKITELEAGQAYTIDTLVSTEEGTTAEIVQDDIIIDELGTYSVKFNVTKDGKESTQSFKYKVVDHTAPTFTKIKDLIVVQGEKFNLADYIKVEDNVKSNLIEQVQVDKNIDTNILGEQTVTLTVKDSSGNEATEIFTVKVIEPRKELVIGNMLSITANLPEGEAKFEFTVDNIYFKDELLPQDTSGVYSYLRDEDGKKFFVVEATLSNIGGIRITDEVFDQPYDSALQYNVIFDNEYKYDMSKYSIEEWGKTRLDLVYIEPFEKEKLLLLVSVPDNVEGMEYEVNIPIAEEQYFIKSN